MTIRKTSEHNIAAIDPIDTDFTTRSLQVLVQSHPQPLMAATLLAGTRGDLLGRVLIHRLPPLQLLNDLENGFSMPFASPPSQETRPRGRQHLNDANPDDPFLQFHSHGLDSFTMHNLPATRFCLNEMEMMKLSIGIECAVCSGEFEEGDWLKHLPNCAHLFHVACIGFQLHSDCPLCRAQAVCNLNVRSESVVSVQSPTGTLDREDFIHERASPIHYQSLRSQILEKSTMARDALGKPTHENA